MEQGQSKVRCFSCGQFFQQVFQFLALFSVCLVFQSFHYFPLIGHRVSEECLQRLTLDCRCLASSLTSQGPVREGDILARLLSGRFRHRDEWMDGQTLMVYDSMTVCLKHTSVYLSGVGTRRDIRTVSVFFKGKDHMLCDYWCTVTFFIFLQTGHQSCQQIRAQCQALLETEREARRLR